MYVESASVCLCEQAGWRHERGGCDASALIIVAYPSSPGSSLPRAGMGMMSSSHAFRAQSSSPQSCRPQGWAGGWVDRAECPRGTREEAEIRRSNREGASSMPALRPQALYRRPRDVGSGDSGPYSPCAVPKLNPELADVSGSWSPQVQRRGRAIGAVFVSRQSPVSFFHFVCDLPPFGTAAMFLASPLVRPYGQVSKRSAAGASRSLLECLGPLGIIHISAPAHRRVLGPGLSPWRLRLSSPPQRVRREPPAGFILFLPAVCVLYFCCPSGGPHGIPH